MDFQKIARTTTTTFFIVSILTSMATTVTATVNTIVGARLSGSEELAGLPGAFIQVGSAIASLLLGLTMDRLGRRVTLAFGVGMGILGGLASAISVVNGSFFWFLAGLTLFGFTRAVSLMGRFVAAEVTPPATRGRAISMIILGSTFGSVVGPYLVDPTGRAAAAGGFDQFVGPYALSAVVFVLTTLVILFFLRPEPLLVARQLALAYPLADAHTGEPRSVRAIFRTPTAFVAMASIVFGHVVMVGLMGITTLHMSGHNHALSDISLVFSAHTLGMFAFSLVTGQLLDRWGRGPVILTGAGMLFAASALAPIWTEVFPLALALFLLGLGWNFTFIGGSTLLSDVLTPEERARAQGANELVSSLTTAVASFVSGLIFATGGYTLAGLIGAALSIIPFAITAWWMMRPQAAVVV